MTRASMSTPIVELMPHLSARAWNTLTTHGDRYDVPEFTTVEQVAATADHVLLDLRNMGPKMLAEIREGVRKALNQSPPAHEPRRGSDVEAWIRARRDEHPRDGAHIRGPIAWDVLNDLLDDYRLHADCGVPLGEEVEGPGGDE